MNAEASSSPSFDCASCGARVEYAPGTGLLSCPYCGHSQDIAAPTRQIVEHSFAALQSKQRVPVSSIAAYHYSCEQCGAKTECDSLSRACQFCASPLVADNSGGEMIPPEAVLPFALDRSGARDALRQWTSSRWFAPNALKKVTETESAKSTYVPHWTFDARTISQYHGQRGQYYYRTETYTDSDGNRQTRQVRETQWFPASGTVYRDFDDVVVPASSHVTKDRLVALEPWKLNDAVPYEPSYLAGHNALRYDQEPEAGLNTAKEQMSSQIRQDCRADIGGDEQRIHSVNTQYNAVTFKLMLLPVWICSYIFNGKPWQILVNGTTGEVQGSRPYSVWKIIGASVAAVAIIVTIIMLIILSQ